MVEGYVFGLVVDSESRFRVGDGGCALDEVVDYAGFAYRDISE